MVVDRTTNLVFDEVDSLSLGSYLFAGDRNAADTLRSTLHESVDVGLTHVPDNHQVVSAVPCCHSHSSDIVLESAGCDLGCDGLHRLRVDILEEFCRRKRNGVFEALGNFVIFELSEVLVFCPFSPNPFASSRFVFVKVFK